MRVRTPQLPPTHERPAMHTRETIVFAFETPEQRAQLMAMIGSMMNPSLDEGLRVVALSVGNEVSRVSKMYETTERYKDRDAIVDAIESLFNTDTPERWTFEQFDKTQ